jgi:hypothetical protein
MMFRLLGLLAALNLRLNRIRILFVPLNLAVAGFLVLGVTSGVSRVVKGPGETGPRDVSVADLAAGRVATGSFVRVSGFLQRGLTLEIGKKGFDGTLHTVRDRLVLLHDASAPAVWVDPGSARPSVSGRVTYEGLVQGLPWAAREATLKEGATIDGRTPSLQVLLRHGTRPRSFDGSVTELALCAPLLALLGCVWFKRSQIFRAREGAAVVVLDPTANEAIDLRVSGRFRLDARTSRHFVEMPAEIQWLQGGGIAAVAYADAGTYVMGFEAVSRSGAWAAIVPAGAELAIVAGEMAFGLRVRPAARIAVRVGGRVTDRLTLSFGSASQRERVLAFLRRQFAAHRAAA